MYENIAYCGLDCNECDAYKATQAQDLERMKLIAERWTREVGTEFTAQDIECDGCKSQKLSGWCQGVCVIRPCAETRNVITCAHCSDYQCEEILKFLSTEPIARENLEEFRRLI
jgi:microsomal dipeptidase-like Zn-dependent dipeptidase